MDSLTRLREKVNGMEWASQQLKDEFHDIIEDIELDLTKEMVSIHTAAQMLDLTERQVHNLAANPDVDIHKYNANGTRKRSNRPTSVYFSTSEILRYNKGK